MVPLFKMVMEAGVKGVKLQNHDIHFTADGEMGTFWGDAAYLDANNGVIDTAK